MLVLPAIDIRGGNCVRLYQGQADQETIYSDRPIQVAKNWQARGAKALHVADLDGAFAGKPVNLPLIAQMRKELQIPIQMGGGFRDLASIEQAYSAGIDRVILGTVAVQNPELVRQAVQSFGSFILVSIDVAGAYAVVAGWKETSMIRADVLAQSMREMGVSELLYTDTWKDGTLSGPNVEGIQAFLAASKGPVTASGGVSSLEDLVALKKLEALGLKGVVVGKALYDGKLNLEDALRIVG